MSRLAYDKGDHMGMGESERLQLSGEHWRISVLGEHLLRYEWSPQGVFEDRPTQVVTRRPFSPVRAQVRDEPGVVQVITAAFQLDYDGTEPSPQSLRVKGRGDYESAWRYGQPLPNMFGAALGLASNLGGTARTLDGADGPIAMGEGLATRNGL
ncbi:MAG: alpha-glucosidase, partial [Propionibacteriaceae bacterium]|nr:alpha-glucosidase [Propionibacteriaceae bacterium]